MTNLPPTPNTLITYATRHRISRWLLNARSAAGLSQEKLASSMGVTRQALAGWEAADGDVTLTTVDKWANALDLEVALIPSRRLPILTDSSGMPVPAKTLSSHVIVVGPNRSHVLTALSADCGGIPVHSLGGLIGKPFDDLEFTSFMSDLKAFRGAPTVVVTEITNVHTPTMLFELLGYARSNRVRVLIGADRYEDIPAVMIPNTALTLLCDGSKTLSDIDGNRWYLTNHE